MDHRFSQRHLHRHLARSPDPGVVVTGEVEHVQTCLAGMRVVVAPLQIARGLQNKVLEAMAMRRPVVATSAVAAGLRVDPGRNILVADDPETFARRITELSRFDGLCDQIGDAGYRCAAMHYSWTDVLHRYERIVLGQPMSDRSEPTADPTPEARHGRSPFAARFRGRPVEALSNPI